MQNVKLDKSETGIKFARKNINSLREADDTTLKAESKEELKSQRIDAFELWCCRRLLRVPWTARRSNQCILKEIRSGCSWKE